MTFIINGNAAEIVQAVNELSRRLDALESRFPDNTDGWAGNQTNVTADRAFDANATSAAELADILGTLINDLINAGVLR